jgi:hypothetical protein
MAHLLIKRDKGGEDDEMTEAESGVMQPCGQKHCGSHQSQIARNDVLQRP